MLFLVGRTIFLVWGVLLTKVKVVHTTLCKTYVEKKHPQHHVFWGECFSSLVPMYAFLCGNMTSVVFSKQHICVLPHCQYPKRVALVGACSNSFFGVFLLFLAKFTLQSSFFSDARSFTRPLFCFFCGASQTLIWIALNFIVRFNIF